MQRPHTSYATNNSVFLCAFLLANNLSCLVSIEDGHLAIHQNSIILLTNDPPQAYARQDLANAITERYPYISIVQVIINNRQRLKIKNIKMQKEAIAHSTNESIERSLFVVHEYNRSPSD